MPQKIVKIDAGGNLSEVASVDSSGGGGDAGKIVALNSSGFVDISMIPEEVVQLDVVGTSAGSSDSGKLPALNGDGELDSSFFSAVDDSSGSGDGEKLVKLNSDGYLNSSILNSTSTSSGGTNAFQVVQLTADGVIDDSMLPTPDVVTNPVIVTIAFDDDPLVGLLVNIFTSLSTNSPAIRAASNADISTRADGVCTVDHGDGTGDVLLLGAVPIDIGGVPFSGVGIRLFLGTAGHYTETPPSTSGSIIQEIGIAFPSNSLLLLLSPPIIRA